jgi:hypothetical protein
VNDGAGQVGARLPGRISLLFAGMMHVVIGSFVVASTRVLPVVAALGLGALWTVLATLIWRWRHVRPLIVLGLPFVGAIALWAVTANVGGA